MSFSWVDAQLVTPSERRREQRFMARLWADARVREDSLRELGDDGWRRSGWVETALYGSRTLRLT